ncbi:Clavaminate synthase-like protein [Nadsonia fulvescens var. elongata DSM 6958]|uniref:Clavaminate synthase-like protein n=1 Tax=Nadsonia fulvescens var. elongata DSM 6958 TaxID=857566 RepID=A0A1E3PK77_9ASCO|nr:Clavaminate synthase-like protein [Nadsonia fulvescens var. elongata DSM 6958]
MSKPECPVAVIDISVVNKETAKQLVEAASTQGFMFIEGSGFTAEEADAVFKMSKEYFELPVDDKNKYPISENNMGYSVMKQEILDPETQTSGDPKEAFNFGVFEKGQPIQPMPEFFQQAENFKLIAGLQDKCKDLCKRLLTLLAIGLEIDETAGGSEWFSSRHNPGQHKSGSIFRLLYYPGQKKAEPEEVIRAGAHTDYGSLTLLFQRENQEGLEILSPVTKSWTPVPYLPAKDQVSAPPILINIADQLSFWTAGILKSSIHRVKFPAKVQESGQDRYSVVYFCHPDDQTLLEPVPSPIVARAKGRGANLDGREVITAGQHLENRLAATYGWKK